MEKLAYNLKTSFAKVIDFFRSPKVVRAYEKTMKVLRNIVPKIVIIMILITFSYIFLSPILRVFVDSLKTKEDLSSPDVVWIPTSLTFRNYLDAGNALWLWRTDKVHDNVIISSLLNSVFFSLVSAITQTIVSCLAGYAFARFDFKGKKFWFIGLIFAFVIPTQLLTLPRSMMLRPLMNKAASPSNLLGIETNNFIDATFSFLSTVPVLLLTVLGQGINSSILIFIAFSFFKMIPVALDEAAQIDGANFFQIFYHIILKMSVPTILVIFLFSFIWNWNDTYVLEHLTSLGTTQLKYQSLPQALNTFNYVVSQGQQMSGIEEANQESNNSGLRSAAIIISITPLLILYGFTQRKFVEGIENTGVTGV